MHTTMNVTGRPAQFGRGVIAEVGGKLVEKFAENLAQLISDGGVGPDGADAVGRRRHGWHGCRPARLRPRRRGGTASSAAERRQLERGGQQCGKRRGRQRGERFRGGH